MDGLLQDIRLAWRGIRAKPGFSAVVIVTLALGIGVNTAVFSLANWVMLRPVPGVRDPARMVLVQMRDHRSAIGSTSYPNLADLKASVPALAGLAGETSDYPIPVRVGEARPVVVRGAYVSSGYFDALGVPLALGRSYTNSEEETYQAAPVVVVSYAFWKSALHGDPAVIGSSFRLAGRSGRVTGVAAESFHGTDLLASIDVWLPGTFLRLGTPQPVTQMRRYGIFFQLVGRLAPGATPALAESQLTTAMARLNATYPEENQAWHAEFPVVTKGIGMRPDSQPAVRHTLAIIVGIALLVLIVACANVANLYLFRSMARRSAMGIRRALGASAVRIARAELIESLVMAAFGGVAAILATTWTLGLFRGHLFSALSHDVTTRLDWRVFAFALLATILTGVLAGLAPAWAAARTEIVSTLKAGPGAHSGSRKSIYAPLVAVQLSISLALVIGTLLLVRTVRNLEAVDVGFDADKIVDVPVMPSLTGYTIAQAQSMLRETMDSLRRTRGIERVAFAAIEPFSYSMGDRLHPVEAPTDSGVRSTQVWTSAEYFETMGIPLVRGRTFDATEEFRTSSDSGAHAMVLSQTLARRLFPLGNALDRIIVSQGGRWSRVIGIVEDSHWASVTDEGNGPVEYSPMPGFAGYGVLVLRSRLPAQTLRRDVDQILAAVAPNTPVGDADLLRDRVRRSFAEQTLLSHLLTAFALITITLAGVGLYGVISFSTARRTREIGIRMALGAQVGQIIGMVLRRGAAIGGAGALLGLAGAVALVRVVRSQLFGISADDPMVYILAIAALAAIVFVATWLPARRAASVDPARVLRAE